jgi:hypothetical protein
VLRRSDHPEGAAPGAMLIRSVASSTIIKATIKSPCWVLVGLLMVMDAAAVLPPEVKFINDIVMFHITFHHL